MHIRGKERLARLLLVALTGVAVVALAGCQSMVTRAAPSAQTLAGLTLEPIPGPVVLRYGPVAQSSFSSSIGFRAELHGQRVARSDALGGTFGITPAGRGLLRIRADFSSVRAEINEEFGVGPFTVDLLVTDRGAVEDVEFTFASGRTPSLTRRRALLERLPSLFPLFEWPAAPVAQGEAFSALTISLQADGGGDSGAIQLKLDGQAMRDGRLVYLVGYEGEAPFGGDINAFSGYYLIDAQTGVIVEQRFTARGKDYFYGEVVLIDYDTQTRISL